MLRVESYHEYFLGWNFSVKCKKILKPQTFSVKQKKFICWIFGAASKGPLKTVEKLKTKKSKISVFKTVEY